MGCGAAQWSIFLTQRGARSIGMDNSPRQLAHAQQLMEELGGDIPLVLAAAEALPFADGSFDLVFCDHGAMSFADPERTLPEVARVLRRSGLLAFNLTSPLATMCYNAAMSDLDPVLHLDYTDLGRLEDGDGMVEYVIPHGEWIRLFRRHGFIIEELIELRAPEGAVSTYESEVALAWARRWPTQDISKARKR
jgi:SAM-dependent methyltransferase